MTTPEFVTKCQFLHVFLILHVFIFNKDCILSDKMVYYFRKNIYHLSHIFQVMSFFKNCFILKFHNRKKNIKNLFFSVSLQIVSWEQLFCTRFCFVQRRYLCASLVVVCHFKNKTARDLLVLSPFVTYWKHNSQNIFILELTNI